MTIYQIYDEANILMGEFSSFERAMEEAEEMTLEDEENHHYRVLKRERTDTPPKEMLLN